jgi:tRNA (guanine-N7-)-methyltransferase
MRVRQHINPLDSIFLSIPIEPLVLPPGAEVEVEMGSAEAHFLMERAAADPRLYCVGVEIRRVRVTEANQEAARRNLGDRVHSVFANMSVDLPRLFPAERVRRFFLNFPDPWFKRKQHKRRVITPALVEALRERLCPGGEVYMASDIFDLALDAMAALEMAGFTNLRAPWTFLRQSPFAERSRRERQCESHGTKIWRLGYRKGQ